MYVLNFMGLWAGDILPADSRLLSTLPVDENKDERLILVAEECCVVTGLYSVLSSLLLL